MSANDIVKATTSGAATFQRTCLRLRTPSPRGSAVVLGQVRELRLPWLVGERVKVANMGVPEKLAEQASAQLGQEVVAAAMVVPPGATLYKSFSPNSKALSGGGAIAAALALTSDRVVYFKKKLLGVGVGAKIAEWPRSDLTFEYEDNGKWSYPGLLIGFSDGSRCAVFGEEKWGLAGIAAGGG